MKQLIFLVLLLSGFVSAGQGIKSCDCCKELKEAFKNAKTGTGRVNGHGIVVPAQESMSMKDMPIIPLPDPTFKGRNEVIAQFCACVYFVINSKNNNIEQ